LSYASTCGYCGELRGRVHRCRPRWAGACAELGVTRERPRLVRGETPQEAAGALVDELDEEEGFAGVVELRLEGAPAACWRRFRVRRTVGGREIAEEGVRT
jgi:hypothetical protein